MTQNYLPLTGLPVSTEPVISEQWRTRGLWEWDPPDLARWSVTASFEASADEGTTGEVRFSVPETGVVTPVYSVTGPTGPFEADWFDLAQDLDQTILLEVRRVSGEGSVRIRWAGASAAPYAFSFHVARFITPPRILGDPRPGGILQVGPPQISAVPAATLGYRWLLDHVEVGTGLQLEVLPGWIGRGLVLEATASNQVGSNSATSDTVIIESGEASGAGWGMSWGTDLR